MLPELWSAILLTMRSLILIMLLAAAASAQTHPNFTGTWKQDDSRSTVRPGSTLKYSNKIDHQDPKLSKTTIMDYGDRQPKPYIQTFIADGTPVKSSDAEGDQITTTVKVGTQYAGFRNWGKGQGRLTVHARDVDAFRRR
jgi:hypothetical protein